MLHLHWAAILAHQWRQRFLQVLKKRKNNIAMSGSTNNKKRTQGTVIKMMTKFSGLLLQGENGFNSNCSFTQITTRTN